MDSLALTAKWLLQAQLAVTLQNPAFCPQNSHVLTFNVYYKPPLVP